MPPSSSALLFLCVRNFRELKVILKTLRRMQGLIQTDALRVIAMTDMEDPRTASLLKGRGCIEVYPTRLMWNSLESNINQSLSILTMHKLMSLTPTRTDGPREITAAEKAEWEHGLQEPFDKSLESKLKVSLGSGEFTDNRLVEAKVLEFGEDSLFLEVPSKIFKQGQNAILVLEGLDLDFDVEGALGGATQAKILVGITAVIPSNDHKQMVTVSVERRFRKYLEPTQKKVAELQIKMTDFMKSARGW